MPSKIKILPEILINRIAAGEVVERPSSIVKELIDNSIDAGSGEIIIRLLDGGKGLISVADNGEGMSAEDAVMAFERHATSKLSSVEELDSIRTMGFRGEALPSIAAVSRIQLTSQTRRDPGVALELSEGRIVYRAEAARAVGTEITVSQLFENYPARRKFLRSASTELTNIISVVNQLALVHPQISFELIHQERKIFGYSAVPGMKERLLQIYGGELLQKLIPLSRGEKPGLEIGGFIALPPHSFGNRTFQEIFVNQRPVRNLTINHAVYEAYSSHLMKGRHPAYFLLLNSDPSAVDVNVHPAKREVRFTNASSVHESVYRAVKSSFSPGESLPESGVIRNAPKGPVRDPGSDRKFMIKEAVSGYLLPGGIPERSGAAIQSDIFRADPTEPELSPRVLGQFQSMFLLVQAGDTLQIIDQHAAHERVLFEREMDRISREPFRPQPLLIPQTLELNIREILVLKEQEDAFREIGIELEFLGETTVWVRTLPDFLKESDIRLLLSDLIAEAELFDRFYSEREKRQKMVATLSCHAAVKAGQTLGQAEMSALVRDLSGLTGPLTCPHGRPIVRHFTLKDLEKMFCRI